MAKSITAIPRERKQEELLYSDAKALCSQVSRACKIFKRPVTLLEIIAFGSDIKLPVTKRSIEDCKSKLDYACEKKIDGLMITDSKGNPIKKEERADRVLYFKTYQEVIGYDPELFQKRLSSVNAFNRTARETIRKIDLNGKHSIYH